MKNYYIRPGEVYVRIENDTKQITNILYTTIQKTISVINNEEYYNTIINQTLTWTVIDELTFKNKFNEALNQLNNL